MWFFISLVNGARQAISYARREILPRLVEQEAPPPRRPPPQTIYSYAEPTRPAVRRSPENVLYAKDIQNVPSLIGYAEPAGSLSRGGEVSAQTPSDRRTLPSPLPGVSADAWTRFVLDMRAQAPGAVSPSNAIGMFAMMPLRLIDLGFAKNARRMRSPASGRVVTAVEFISPMTEERFTGSPALQYATFVKSMTDYDRKLKTPDKSGGMTRSGALAVLHRSGPKGLKSWSDPKKRFPATEELYRRVNGIF
jgi:hypothetical protein